MAKENPNNRIDGTGKRTGKPRNKRNNGKPHNKPSNDADQQVDVTKDNKPGNTPVNDPAQFIPSSETSLLDSLTWFTFPQVMGRDFTLKQVPLYTGAEGLIKLSLPTASQIRLSPSIGGSTKSALDPINVAATNIYVRLSARNNKTTSYAPQDVMTLVLAMGQIIAMEEYIRRALKITFNVNSNNLSVPRGYFKAMGIDFDDYRANIADYRDRFNVIISSINAITFMADIPYIGYCKDIYSRIFKDSVTNMYGVHIPVPGHTWQISEVEYFDGTILKDVDVVEQNSTKVLGYYMTILEDMITSFKLSSTFNVIYSDILALYDKDHFNTIEIPLFSPAEQLEYDYNIMFNIMLRHGTIIGDNYGELVDSADPDGERTRNTVFPSAAENILYQDFVFKRVDDYLMWNRLVNFYETNSPDANTRFEMTRWMAIGGVVSDEEFSDGSLAIREPVIQNTFINSVDLYLGDDRIVGYTSNVVNVARSNLTGFITLHTKMANLPMQVLATLNDGHEITTAQFTDDLDAWSSVDLQYLTNLRNQTMIYFFGA